MQFRIATCKNRWQDPYRNESVTWDELLDRIRPAYHTKETVQEYRRMSKKEQGTIKDVGGFVGGYLQDGHRNNLSIIKRSLITLDIDFAPVGFWEAVQHVFPGNCLAMYSTHKHVPEKPKYRLIVPLSREINPDEYEPLARMVASMLGIDYFDDTTYQAARLMFWPSTPKDGVYEFYEQEGKELDPDLLLDEYIDWKDITSWPLSSRQQELHKRAVDKQEDPLAKPGFVGAFCRTYSIQDAIAKFLPDVYEATDSEDRYTYIQGSTEKGLVIYDDKFAYSNHATDPISTQLCNAFDLVRIHLFRDLDEDLTPGTPTVKRPSWTRMLDFCEEDPDCKATLMKERYSSAEEDFKDLEGTGTNWLTQLETDKRGNIKTTIDNAVLILTNDEALKGIGGDDLFNGYPVKSGDLPWWRYDSTKPGWSDSDDAQLRYYLEKTYQLKGKSAIEDGLRVVHQRNEFHPVRDYLNGLPAWDGTPRLDTLFIDYHGVEDTEYTRAVTRKAITACVKRVMEPGCKMDYTLVLVGPQQGTGKSWTFSTLGGKWFNDTISDIKGKEAYEALDGSWIIELAELTFTRRTDIEGQRQFLTKTHDKYRKAYGRRVSNNPRQCVFFGTTNDVEFLRDYAGNRRYWPLLVRQQPVKKDLFKQLPQERDQIFAEALMRYKEGEELFLPPEIEAMAIDKQEEFRFHSSREELIRNFLERKLPKDWAGRDIWSRADWLNDPNNEGTEERTKVCALEVWCELLGGSKANFPNSEQREIKMIIEKCGWERTPGAIKFSGGYGKQRGFKRSKV